MGFLLQRDFALRNFTLTKNALEQIIFKLSEANLKPIHPIAFHAIVQNFLTFPSAKGLDKYD